MSALRAERAFLDSLWMAWNHQIARMYYACPAGLRDEAEALRAQAEQVRNDHLLPVARRLNEVDERLRSKIG